MQRLRSIHRMDQDDGSRGRKIKMKAKGAANDMKKAQRWKRLWDLKKMNARIIHAIGQS